MRKHIPTTGTTLCLTAPKFAFQASGVEIVPTWKLRFVFGRGWQLHTGYNWIQAEYSVAYYAWQAYAYGPLQPPLKPQALYRGQHLQFS